MKKSVQFPFPVFITKENNWFIAECSILNIATQGKTENESKKNMEDLIEEYIRDPDVPKIDLGEIKFSSLSYIPVQVPLKNLYGKNKAAIAK